MGTLNTLQKDALLDLHPHAGKKNSRQFGYDTYFSSRDYHIIGHKDGRTHDLQVLPNDNKNTSFNVNDDSKIKARTFWGYNTRRPIASNKYPPNEARFDIINKNPRNSTGVRRVPQVSFTKT